MIIWSATSANSNWVLSEADHAIRQGKLVNAHHSDILPEHLPKPFGQIHAVPLTDTDRILRAIKLITTGKPPKATAVSAGETRAIEFITDAIQDALKYAPQLRDLADRAGWEATYRSSSSNPERSKRGMLASDSSPRSILATGGARCFPIDGHGPLPAEGMCQGSWCEQRGRKSIVMQRLARVARWVISCAKSA
ncbi:hypothetical protein ACVWZZ_002589 [Bradyrhizobium sp. LM6.10]